MRTLLILLFVLALVGGQLPPRVTGQTPAGAGARDAVRVYLETLQLVISTICDDRSSGPRQSRCPGEHDASTALLELYRTTLSAHTRGRITEYQLFSAYLGRAAMERGRPDSRVAMSFDVGEPVLNERGDVALVPAGIAAEYIRLDRRNWMPSIFYSWGWLISMVVGRTGTPWHTLEHHTTGGGGIGLVFIAVLEGHQWRVVLPDAAVQEIQKTPVMPAIQILPVVQVLRGRAGPRYAPHASVADAGVTLTVLDVTLEQDETILRLALANNSQDAVVVADALRRATLADEAGKESRARPPRETPPDRLAGASAVGVTLVFDPVPAASRTAALVLPDLRVGERPVTLKLAFSMRSAAYPMVGETGISGEPLLLYLMNVLRPAVLTVPDEAPLRQFYQRHLTAHTRGQITEADFVAHWTTRRARARWERPFGESGQIHDLDFVVGPPVYSASRDHALVPATIKTRGSSSILSPPTSRAEEITFRVIRDGQSWRLELPDRVVEEIQPPRPAGVLARWFPNARAAEAGIGIWVRQVAVEKDVTRLDFTVENGQVAEASLFEAMAAATLTDEQGKTFFTRMLRTTVPDRLAGRSSVTAIMAFEPIPVGSTRLVLTIPGIRVVDQSVTISLPIVLVRF